MSGLNLLKLQRSASEKKNTQHKIVVSGVFFHAESDDDNHVFYNIRIFRKIEFSHKKKDFPGKTQFSGKLVHDEEKSRQSLN